ncbi:coadhesin [Lingula anatina]|uniref:Coadhesin n=1 Tax=Lingula anatina TaxID=7574 RepID=A0A1S3JED2_LINAN|nr:coadhesin [Lingula anatina]|eukprot:XP_013408767.1 coadhesin [Lingula anatina]
MWRELIVLCLMASCLETVTGADYYCFRRYVTKVSGCKGIVRRKYPTPQHCCARSNADGYAVALVSLGKKFYECRKCSDLTKTTPAKPPLHKMGEWAKWGEWGKCSKSCGAGAKQRTRLCPAGGCPGTPDQMRPCMDRQYCPVDGGFGPWHPWESCSASCNGGIQRRQRFCNSPRPEHGGKDCVGNTTQSQVCKTQPCPVDGGWGAWSGYSTCSKTCGNGRLVRSRECNNPAPQHGGQECTGMHKQKKRCTLKKCPIDGDWSLWTDWTPCSVTCGTGSHTRSRECVAPRPRFGGRPCTGNDTDVLSCYVDIACPVNGGWSSWSSWSTCEAPPCSGIRGVQLRFRACNNPSPKLGGLNCIGDATEQRKCHNNITCPSKYLYCYITIIFIFLEWAEWGEWGKCSKSCGAGAKQRTRLCPAGGCPGTPDQMRPCMDRQYCPVDGGFGPWHPWESCSASCNGGIQRRQRFCNSPRPEHGGKDCVGNTTQSQVCKTQPCPVDGGWGAWSGYSTCSKTCGNGRLVRSRECNNPAPQHGGQECTGMHKQKKRCTLKKCPIDGDWSLWTDWTPCSVTCGTGSHTRSRECVAPRPRFGGRPCTGNDTDVLSCYVDIACPVNGGWSSWSSWSTCEAPPCSGIRGVQLRFRACNNPSPKLGGLNCIGDATEQRKCHNNITCPSHGDWCSWAEWGVCSQSCGSGYKARFRNCSCPEPQNNGNDCIGSNYEIVACKSLLCGKSVPDTQIRQRKGCSTRGHSEGSGSGGGWNSDGSEVECDQEDDSVMNDDDEVGSSQGSGYDKFYEYPYGFFNFNHLYHYKKYNSYDKEYSSKDKN